MTGADLVAAIRRRAAEMGTTAAKLYGGTSRLIELGRAKNPNPKTVARVEALLAGEEPPPRRGYTRQYCAEGDKGPPVPDADPVDRDPCFFCGTRADLGCRHRRAAV